jgi:hypothetical protein
MVEMENTIGGLFTPCFMTEDDFENAYKESIFYVEKNYMEEYRKHMAAMGHIANIAKSYILNNWKKVTDWSDLNLTVTHGQTGVTTEYYNHDKVLAWRKREEERADKKLPGVRKSRVMSEMLERLEKDNKERHNPIIEFNAVVLDPTDGDFSVTINGKEHWWIGDDAIMTIADYIEKQLAHKEVSEPIGTPTED